MNLFNRIKFASAVFDNNPEAQKLFKSGQLKLASEIDQPAKRPDVETTEAINAFIKRNPVEKADGGMLVKPSVDGSRPGYKGKTNWTTKEVQEIYKDLPEGMYVQKRTLPSGKIDYTYRAKIRYKGKVYNFPSKVATPENKKQLIKDLEAKYDELIPNRLSREEYAKLRLLPENRRLKGEEFAAKLNKMGKEPYYGGTWNNKKVYNYDLASPRTKTRIADDLGFFEKRTVKEAKEIIKRFSGGKHFLKNKNLKDSDITTRASAYIAMEKFEETSGTGRSWPRGKQNKRKVWTNIYNSYRQGGKFELINEKELADADGKVNWKKDLNWRKAKFKDKKSGAIFTYDNLEKMVDKHGGGYQKAIKPYNDNAILNQTTFKGKTLNSILTEGLLKKEYETLIGKKVRLNDVGLLKYISEKKPYYSFVEAHHTEGVKDNPFKTESAFKYANREQGIIQKKYNAAVASGDVNKISEAKKVYINDMNRISNELGGIRYKTDNRFIGTKGTSKSIVEAAAKESGFSDKKIKQIIASFGSGTCAVEFGKAAAEGGRIGYKTGTVGLDDCFKSGITNMNSGNYKTADQVNDARNLLLKSKNLLRAVTKYGVLPELAFIGLESAGRTIMGDSVGDSIKKSIDTFTFGLTDFTSDINKKEFDAAGGFGDMKLNVDKYKANFDKVQSLKRDIQNLEAMNVGGEFGYMGSRDNEIAFKKAALKKAEQKLLSSQLPEAQMKTISRMEDNLYDAKRAKSSLSKAALKDQMDGISTFGLGDYTGADSGRMFPTSESQEKMNLELFPSFRDDMKKVDLAKPLFNQTKEDLMTKAKIDEDEADKFLNAINFYKNIDNLSLSDAAAMYGDEQTYGTQGTFGGEAIPQTPAYDFSEGGIASLSGGDKSGAAPKSGPQPQGLPYVYNRVKRT